MKGHTKQVALCSILTALSMMLSILERMIPLGMVIPVPGIKLGLANIVTLFALTSLSMRDAATILFCRVTLVSIFAGSISGFLFSLFGGFLALFVMAFLLQWKNRVFSLRGISIAGAAAHNIGQICAAMLMLGTVHVMGYLPLLLLTAIPLGFLTGTVCDVALLHLKKIQ